MSNCLIFALGRWFRCGGHVVVRKSNFGWWPHFIWSKDLVSFEEFIPNGEKRRRLIPPPLFRGIVRKWTA